MGIFNRNKIELEAANAKVTELQTQISTGENKKIELLRAISTDGEDLSIPFIDDNFTRGTSWSMFGQSNLYPNILNELYLSSPMHAACVNFKTWSLIGDGYEWDGYAKLDASKKVDIKAFERKNNFKAAAKKISKDWIKHGRAIVLLHYNAATTSFDSFKVVDPSEIRNTRVTLFEEVKTYTYSGDWTYGTRKVQFTPYSPINRDEWQILEIKNDVGSSRTYGLPDWVSSANWQKVSASLGLLHKSALENGIQPSVIFKYPYIMSDEEDRNWVQSMQNNYKGVQNYNRGMKVEAQGNDMMPEIEVVPTTDNHQLFEQTSKEQKEEIAISHNINPALMGVRIAGSLGASEEIEFSSKQFEKIWLNDNRTIIEDFLNEITVICGINTELIINNTELTVIGGEIARETELEAEKELLVESGPIVNDNLKGLTAKENADIYRIVRDFSRSKLNKTIAITRLLAYGFTNEEAENILTEQQ